MITKRWIYRLMGLLLAAQLLCGTAAAAIEPLQRIAALSPTLPAIGKLVSAADWKLRRRGVPTESPTPMPEVLPVDEIIPVPETISPEEVVTSPEEVPAAPEQGISPLGLPVSPLAVSYGQYRVGYGVPLNDAAIIEYGRYFWAEPMDSSWGTKYAWFGGPLVVPLPTAEELGRVPDKEFVGWYLYGEYAESSYDNPVLAEDRWVYGTGEELLLTGNELIVTKQYPGTTSGGTLPIVGRWKDSTVAKARSAVFTEVRDGVLGAPIELYDTDISQKATGADIDDPLTDIPPPVDFDPDKEDAEYWMRVGADVTAVDLSFVAYEPYYQYFKNSYGANGTPPVTVTADFAGTSQVNYTSDFFGGNANMAPAPSTTGMRFPNNTPENAARSEWNLGNIALHQAADDGSRLYNNIQVTVTSPDGSKSKTYLFHIQRMSDPVMTMKPGNTPYGMIERDSNWNGNTAKKEAAKASFAADLKFIGAIGDKIPPSEANNYGELYSGKYYDEAWPGGVNYDLDPTAIVVYQDSAFRDPGISLTDTQGKEVTIGSGMYAGTVSRTIQVRTADRLTADLIGAGKGTLAYYADGDLYPAAEHPDGKSEALLSDNDLVDLRGLNILPGIYFIEYSYTDPMSGITYDSSGGFQQSTGNSADFRRAMIVLPTPGDMDMDGVVTPADAQVLRKLANVGGAPATTINGSPIASDSVAALMAYRVIDVGRDGTVDADDVSLLVNGFLPNRYGSPIDYFYLPLPGGTDIVREELLSAEIPGATRASLTLEYLGKETAEYDSTTGRMKTEPGGPNLGGSDDEIQLGDIFWMGVKLSDVAKSQQLKDFPTSTFTLALTYDNRYLEPAAVVASSDTLGADDNPEGRWKFTLRKYNLTANADTIWRGAPGQPADYIFSNSLNAARPYRTHCAKAVTPLEKSAGENNLAELVFSIDPNGAISKHGVTDGWLLMVPFTLKAQPFGVDEAQLVELGAGMREFVITNEVGSTTDTWAYSTQDKIFGGATKNLRDSIAYSNGPGVLIPLGEDLSEVTLLKNRLGGTEGNRPNAEYGALFETEPSVLPPGGSTPIGDWPIPGLSYGSSTGWAIRGTPEKAGTYNFIISGARFQIIVQKAELRFYADNKETYYGETVFRDEAPDGFTYTFYTDGLKDRDAARAAQNGIVFADGKGKGSDLAILLDDVATYQEPALTARVNGEPVAQNTGIGRYAISADQVPEATNYVFIYEPRGELVISRRPISIEKLVLGPLDFVGSIYENGTGTLINCEATSEEQPPKAQLIAALPLGVVGGLYSGSPLTNPAILPGDALSITYTGEYQRTPEDYDAQQFVIPDGQYSTTRPVLVKNIQLVAGEAANNYTLIFTDATKAEKNPTVEQVLADKGIVLKRQMKSINLVSLPPLNYVYGDTMANASALRLNVTYMDGRTTTDFIYSLESFATYKLQAGWISGADMLAVQNKEVEFDPNMLLPFAQGQLLTVNDHNGKYLCVYSMQKDEDDNDATVIAFSTQVDPNPFVVAKRQVVLTAAPAERYYGEPDLFDFEYTYRISDLFYRDIPANAKGKGTELEGWLAGYVKPEMDAIISQDNRTPVAIDTPASAVPYRIVISGASADNYRFVYAIGTGASTSAVEGYSNFTVHRRPIVVSEVVGDVNLADIYADTKRVYVENRTLTFDQFKAILPTNDATGTTYYPAGGTATTLPNTNKLTYGNPDAFLSSNLNIGLTYTATFMIDNPYYGNFTTNYFNMNDAVDGEKQYNVQISNIALTGPDAVNYQLVYIRNDDAKNGYLSERIPTLGPAMNSTAQQVYYVAGKGTVHLRPIASIEISANPKLEYTYGEQFTPEAPVNSSVSYGMRVRINYETAPYENYSGNTTSEMVTFIRQEIMSNGKYNSTFRERGIDIYCVPEGGTADDAQLLEYAEYLTVSDHDGSRLMVIGKREGSTTEVQSTLENAPVLTVHQKSLTITAVNQYRYYGEKNSPYTFTFQRSALAKPDRDLLDEKGISDATLTGTAPVVDGQGTSAQAASAALSWLGGYVGPVFKTEARASSNVLSGGSNGYDLTLDVEHARLANYNFVPAKTAAKIYVFRRPIWVQSVDSATNKPVYTIYSDTAARQFTIDAEASTDPTRNKLGMALPGANPYGNNSDPVLRATPNAWNSGNGMPLSGSAIANNDALQVTLRVDFGSTLTNLGAAAGVPQSITVTDAYFTSAAANSNYFMINSNELINHPIAAWGAVELREIQGISIEREPRKLEYEYGESLDLSGLEVLITYKVLDAGAEQGLIKTDRVGYQGTAQFASYGLSVHYYNSNVAPTTTTDIAKVATMRLAETGDHMTVTYTQDTQGKPGNERFTPNGKYLIVYAQRHENQDPGPPKIVSQTKLKVNPLPLYFTLEADDKTYDGQYNAVGTLRLTNAFNQPGQVDAHHPNGITDVVYVVTGAGYEGTSDNHADYSTFKTHVAASGYAFTTGTYDPGDRLTDGLSYTGGTYGDGTNKLTLAFTNPNVNYKSAPDPVLGIYGELDVVTVTATGIRLAGPDAANYTIIGAVEEGTEATYQGGGVLPTATIRKAARPAIPNTLLPAVQVDEHTNAVRLSNPLNLVGFLDEPAAYQGEVHFEYALQYEDSGTLRQWAGEDGSLRYQRGSTLNTNLAFFGGETEGVAPAVPIGYTPDARDIPTEIRDNTVIKGQRYKWVAEDDGMQVDGDSYPGGAAYLGYELYKTDRTPLPRGTTFWAVARLAETHNYEASPALSSVDGMTSAMLTAKEKSTLAVAAAETALALAGPGEAAAAQAALEAAQADDADKTAPIFAAAQPAVQDARAAAQAAIDAALAIAESGRWPEDMSDPAPSEAVKTYIQRLDLMSVESKRSAITGDQTNYMIPTLESVWFTDVLDYGGFTITGTKLMDTVVHNSPTRYYGYYWDAWDGKLAAKLDLDSRDVPFTLRDPIADVEVDRLDTDGKPVKTTITVNEDNTADVYVSITAPSGGSEERRITIYPSGIDAYLDDEPVQLEVEFVPADVSRKTITWESSDEGVATVSTKGLVSFIGVGETTITATSYNGKTDSIPVTVREREQEENPYPNSIFDLEHLDAFFKLDEELMFHPEWIMTRGELVFLLAQFYKANENWTHEGVLDFPDLNGKEAYAEAARLLSSLGVINGVDGGLFDGERKVTRAEMIVMLARMLNIDMTEAETLPQVFLDVSPKDTWAYAYIAAMVRAGIVKGVGDGYFAPGRQITRAEVATFLARLLAYKTQPAAALKIIPVDVKADHWAHKAILTALNGSQPLEEPKQEET